MIASRWLLTRSATHPRPVPRASWAPAHCPWSWNPRGRSALSLERVGLLKVDGRPTVIVFVKIIKRPRSWVTTASLLLVTSLVPATAAAAAPAVPALLNVKAGTATFCLEPQARQALDAAGITMSAGAPAQLVTVGPQPCATTHVTEGAIALGLTGGEFPFRGTITFTRAADNAHVTFSEMGVTFGVPSTVTAKVDENAANPVTLLTFVPLPGNIMTDGRYLIAHDVPLNLTDDGANAFAAAFSTSPVASGKPLFIGTGHGELEIGELPLLPALG